MFRQAVQHLSEVVEEALAANGLTGADIDWLVPHQANLRIIDAIGKRLKLRAGPDRDHHRAPRQYLGGVDPAGA